MTAAAVIEEIKQLPRAEQSRALQFAFEPARGRRLPGEDLAGLAQRMADSNDPAEKKRLREEIHRGFHGELHAADSPTESGAAASRPFA